MKKVISISTLFLALTLMSPSFAAAEDQVCTQSYGQPVVCTTKTPPPVTHSPVKAGIAGLSLPLIALVSLTFGSVVFYRLNRVS